MTLINFEKFKKIPRIEFITGKWSKGDKANQAKNIINFTDCFNELGEYVATEIVSRLKLKERKRTLKKFLNVAYESFLLNNFADSMAIFSGLQNVVVFRLAETWKSLDNKTKEIWEKLQEYFSNDTNFKFLKTKTLDLVNKSVSCIPFIGIFQKELVYINDSMPTYLSQNDIKSDKESDKKPEKDKDKENEQKK